MDWPGPRALSLDVAAPDAVDTDLLAVPAFEGGDLADLADLAGLEAATAGEVARAFSTAEFTGKLFETFLTPAAHPWKTRRLLLVGAGPRAEYDAERARRIAATAALTARQHRAARLAVCIRTSDTGRQALRLVQATAEGAVLSEFDVARYKSRPPEARRLSDVRVIVPDVPPLVRTDAAAALERGRVLAECTNLARELGNEPSNHLTPRLFVERAVAAMEGTGLGVDVLDQQRLEALGMRLLLGVAQGSAEPPRLLVLRHDPPGAPAAPVLGLVGKGVTFDTGGISIKPAEGMEHMKVDMAGGAAVIGALRAAALLNAPVRIVGIIPSVENMPGGRAVKPGDVLRAASGLSVEIINTDAEGRLILGDALWYAGQLGATHLVDVATLTGACVVALGSFYSGVFGTPAEFVEAVRQIGSLTGDPCWPMPASDEYAEQIKSDIADFKNTGGRPGGAVTAAVFLKQFTGGRPWAHLDIAGTAWLDEDKPFMAKGATGAATRLLAELGLNPEAWQATR